MLEKKDSLVHVGEKAVYSNLPEVFYHHHLCYHLYSLHSLPMYVKGCDNLD